MSSGYFNSTQHKNWTYKKEQIEELHSIKYKRGFALIQKLNQVETKNVLKPVQEALIIKDFIRKIINICKTYSLSSTLKSHVISFFKRFYLKKLILDFDIYYIFYACFYLGFKVVEIEVGIGKMGELFSHLSPNTMSNISYNDRVQKLFKYEFYLLDVIGYDLHVYCPYKALKGMIYDMFKSNYDHLSDESDYKQFEFLLFKDISQIIDVSFYSDLCFLYSYSKIAVFSLVFYWNHELNTKINHFLLENNVFLINFSDLKSKISIYIDSIKRSCSWSSDFFEDYDFFDEEIKKNLVAHDENEVNRLLAKSFKFIKDNTEYNSKLEEKREVYIRKLKDFSEKFEKLESGNEGNEGKEGNEEYDFIHKKRRSESNIN